MRHVKPPRVPERLDRPSLERGEKSQDKVVREDGDSMVGPQRDATPRASSFRHENRRSMSKSRSTPIQQNIAPLSTTHDLSRALQDWRRMFEDSKKEVREIRAVEARMRWDLWRDENRSRILDEKAVETEIRDWRRKQSHEMKTHMEEKNHDALVRALLESKQLQEFRREQKMLQKEEDLKAIEEQRVQDIEDTAWMTALTKTSVERQKLLLHERAKDLTEARDVKQQQSLANQMITEEERQIQRVDEMLQIKLALTEEKERVLASLQRMHSCQIAVTFGQTQHG